MISETTSTVYVVMASEMDESWIHKIFRSRDDAEMERAKQQANEDERKYSTMYFHVEEETVY